MIINAKLTGSSTPIWAVLFLPCHLLPTTAAALFRVAPTRGINTFIASRVTPGGAPAEEPTSTYFDDLPDFTPILTTFDYTEDVPSATPSPTISETTALPPFQTLTLSTTIVSSTVARETLAPHQRGRPHVSTYNYTESPPINQQPEQFTPHEYYMRDPFDFSSFKDDSPATDTSFDSHKDHANSSSEPSDSEYEPFFVAQLSQRDEKRLGVLLGSQVHRFGSFIINPIGGYTLDCGLNWLPKNWSPHTDPPRINDFVNEWTAAVTAKNQETVNLEAERKFSVAARLDQESVTAKSRQDNAFLGWIISRALDTQAELDDKLEEAAFYQRMQIIMSRQAEKKDKHAREKYLEGVTMTILANRARDRMDHGCTSVALFIPPMYPPLLPTPFALFNPATWCLKAALQVAGDKSWSIYQAICLRIALLSLFCLVYTCVHEGERNILFGSHPLSDHDVPANGDFLHESPNTSTLATQPDEGRTQHRDVRTEVAKSGRQSIHEATLNSRSSAQFPSQSEAASHNERESSPPRSEPVMSPFPSGDSSFTVPKSDLAHRRSPSPSRVSDTLLTSALYTGKEKSVDTSLQKQLESLPSCRAGPSTAKEGKRVDTKHSVRPACREASPSPLVFSLKPTPMNVFVAASVAGSSVEKKVETINHTMTAKTVETNNHTSVTMAPGAFRSAALNVNAVVAPAPKQLAATDGESIGHASVDPVLGSLPAFLMNSNLFASLARQSLVTTNVDTTNHASADMDRAGLRFAVNKSHFVRAPTIKPSKPINHASLAVHDNVVSPPTPNTSLQTAVQPISFNPFPFHSIATRTEVNGMPIHKQPISTLHVQPVASGYTFFKESIARHPTSSNIPAAPSVSHPMALTNQENTASTPFPEVAQFPYPGAYPPWSDPEQSSSAMNSNLVSAAPFSQRLLDRELNPVGLRHSAHFEPIEKLEEPYAASVQEEEVSTTTTIQSVAVIEETVIRPQVEQQQTASVDPVVVAKPVIEIQPTAQPEATNKISTTEPTVSYPPVVSSPVSSEAVEFALATVSPSPTLEIITPPGPNATPDTSFGALDPLPKQNEATKKVGSPSQTRSSEGASHFPIRRTKSALEASRKSMSMKGKAAANEPDARLNRKKGKGSKSKTNKTKAVRGGLMDGVEDEVIVRAMDGVVDEVEGGVEEMDQDDAGVIDDLLDEMCVSDEDEDVRIDSD